MRPLLGMAVVAAALALSGPAAAASADKVTPAQTQAAKSGATDFSARRRHYRHNYRARYSSYRPYPTYYARPVHYRPYPYAVPAPFVFGIGYGPFW
jgi:hypothetical protein